MITIRVLFAALLGLVTVTARAEPIDDAYAALARARQALGGEAWNRTKILHATMALACGGLDGRQETWSQPSRGYYAERYSLGPNRGAQGWTGRTAWSVDWAGRVHQIDRANAGELRATAFWSSFAFLFTDRATTPAELAGLRHEGNRSFDLVRLTPPGLRSLELWLDTDTALPARLVLRGAPDLVVTYADYRPVAGLKLPFRVTISDGLAQNDQRLDMERIDSEELRPDADPFAVPAAAPLDYSFLDGSKHSFSELTPTGSALLVDVIINGQGPYPFALDTGATNALDSTLADELGLAVAGRFSGRGAGELPADLGLTRADAVAIGDVRLRDQLFRVLPLSALTPGARVPYRGLLGFEIFDRFVVHIDQDLREVELSEPTSWSFDGDVKPVAFRLHGRVPMVDGVIDGVQGRFTLDTGQANSLTLYRPFMVRVGIERKYEPKMSVIVGEGIGGPIRAEVARGQRLTLGNASVSSPVLYLSLQKNGVYNDADIAGNVGGAVFLHYNTTFDYTRRQVFFEHSRTYGDGDSLGLMSVKRVRQGLQVLSVLPGGPVADAGLRPDDVIESINFKDAATVDYTDIQRLFRRPAGTKIVMSVRSRGELKNLVVVLTEAI